MQERGLVHIYWGEGKGKTTTALGTALRAIGYGYKVHLVQFMKNGAENLDPSSPDKRIGISGEIASLIRFPNFSYKRFGTGEWSTKEGRNSHIQEVENGYNHVLESLDNNDLVIADEILYTVQFGLLDEDKVKELIQKKPRQLELMLTGSHQPLPNLFELADYVTEIRKIKHPYEDQGIQARKGIDL
jgi:cob(I)alamin adenosyltransferase